MFGIHETEFTVWHPARAVDAVCVAAVAAPGLICLVWVACLALDLWREWKEPSRR